MILHGTDTFFHKEFYRYLLTRAVLRKKTEKVNINGEILE